MESPYISEDDSVKAATPSTTNSGKKRQTTDDSSKSKKKRRKTPNSKKETIDRDDIDEENGINRTIAGMGGDLLADLFARQTKRFEPELSVVELEDRRIPGSAFVDTSTWTTPRTLENLPSFLERFTFKNKNQLSEAPAKNGSPHTIFIAASGIRAADLTRALRVYQRDELKDVKIAKMFAKHIKLKDACAFLENTRVNIAVGTPQRLIDASEAGALSLEDVSHVVMDASHVDEKRRGLLDIRETEAPTVRFVGLGAIKRRLMGGGGGGGFEHPSRGPKQGSAESGKQIGLVVF